MSTDYFDMFWAFFKGLLEDFQTYLKPWKLCKYSWRYDQMKFVIVNTLLLPIESTKSIINSRE